MKKIFFLLFLLSFHGFAQLPVWNLQAVVEPYPTSFYSVWQNNQSSSYVVVGFNGTARVSYKVRFILKSAAGAELIRTTSPLESFETGPAAKTYFAGDFLAWSDTKYNNATLEKIVRTNRFPEGVYEEIIQLLSTSGTILEEKTANFSIIYPDAPVLLDPVNNSMEERTVPVFSWTPVNLPPGLSYKYNLKIVKRFSGQSVAQAIAANPAFHEVDLVNTASYFYPLSAMQFENGQEYVWRIRVVDDNGNPLTANDGNSEFWTFTYNNPNAPGFTLPFSKVDLEKNVVWFTDFSQLQITAGTSDYKLHGKTTLYIRLADGNIKDVPATVSHLRIRRNKYNPFDFIYGRVNAILPEGTIAKELTGEFFKPEKLNFEAGEGVTIEGKTTVPKSGAPLSSPNGLLVLPTGKLRGIIQFYNPTEPLFVFGNQAVKIAIKKLQTRFPDTRMLAEGEVTAFGATVTTPLKNAFISPEGLISGETVPQESFTWKFAEPYAEQYMIMANSSEGEFSYNTVTNEANITIPLTDASLQMNVRGLFEKPLIATAKFTGKLVYASNAPEESGFITSNPQPLVFIGVPIAQNRIRIGTTFVSEIASARLDSITYTQQGLDFRISLGLQYRYPGLQLLIPNPVMGVYRKDGVLLPSLSSANLATDNGIPPIRLINGVAVNFKKVNQQELLFTGTSEPLGIRIDGTLQFNKLPLGTTEALRTKLNAVSILLSPDSLLIRVPDPAVPVASIPLTYTTRFRVERISGDIVGKIVDGVYNYSSALKVSGYPILPTGVMGTTTTTSLHKSALLNMDAYGKITGTVQQILPGWSMKIGQLPLFADKFSVKYFIGADDKQEVQIAGSGKLNHRSITNAVETTPITYTYNILSEKMVQVTGSFQGNAVISVPYAENEPRFKLSTNEVIFTPLGALVNGRKKVTLGSASPIDVTSDSMIFSYNSFWLQSGSAILDKGIGVLADITPSGLGYKLANTSYIERSYNFPADNKIIINLPSGSRLTKNGFVFPENSDSAYLRYKGNEAVLKTVFHDMAAAFTPFSPLNRNLEFYSGTLVAATLTPNEFTINEDAFITPPERIPIPSLSTAYLSLRSGNQSYVDVTNENSNWRIKSKSNQKVPVIFPAFSFVSGEAPTIPVTLDILVDKSNNNIISGEINGSVPAANQSAFDLTVKGIPAKLQSFRYAPSESGLYALTFASRVVVFGNEYNSQTVTLQLSSSGLLQGEFSIAEAKQFSLKSGKELNRIVLATNVLHGEIQTLVRPSLSVDYVISLPGRLQLQLEDGSYKGGSANFRVSPSGMEIHNFKSDDFSQAAKLSFGRLKFSLSAFRIASLSFQDNSWKYAVEFDAVPDFSLQGFAFSGVANVQGFRITDALGLELPSTTISLSTLPVTPVMLDGFGMRITSLHFPKTSTGTIAPDAVDINKLNIVTGWRVAFPGFPTTISASLRELSPSVSARIKNNVLTGTISSNKLYGTEIPMGTQQAAFAVAERVTGNLLAKSNTQGIELFVEGKVRVAKKLCAPDEKLYIELATGAKVNLYADAKLSGTVPASAILGSSSVFTYGSTKLTASSRSLEFSIVNNAQRLLLNADVTARSEINQGVILSGQGAGVKLNLLTGNIHEGQVKFPNATVALPQDRSVFTFTVPTLVLSNTGFIMNGEGKVNLSGTLASASMANFTFDPRKFSYTSGEISIPSQFAMNVTSTQSGLQWKAVNGNYVLANAKSVGFIIPANTFKLTQSFSLQGNSTGKMLENAGPAKDATVKFTGSPVVNFSDLSIAQGSIEFYNGNFKSAYIDNTGLVFKNSSTDIPEKLKLESEAIAYLQLRQGTEKNVTVTPEGDNLRLTTTGSQLVPLFVPGLKYSQSGTPQFKLTLNIVVNPTTWEVISGTVNHTAASGAFLRDLSSEGIPLRVTGVTYKKGEFGYRFSVTGKTILPPALSELEAELSSIEFLNGKLSGFYSKGTVSNEYNPTAGYTKKASVGSNTVFKLQGVSYDFDAPASFKVSGDILHKMFIKTPGDTSAVHFTASYSSAKKQFDFACTPGASGGIQIQKMNFKPEGSGSSPAVSLTFDNSDFKLLMNGTLKAPTISSLFMVTLNNVAISKANVSIPPVDLTGNQVQQFSMFGSNFRVKNIAGKPAITAAYLNDSLSLSLNGELIFLGKTIVFQGFQVTSKGNLKIEDASGSFVKANAPIILLEDRMRVTKLELGYKDNAYNLKVSSGIQLPKPASSDWIPYGFVIPSAQPNSGDITYQVLDEAPGLGSDNSEWDFWAGKYDVQNIALKLDYGDVSQSEIQVVSEFYVDGVNTQHNIRFGGNEGGELTPGLTMKFDNSNTWVEELAFSDKVAFSYNNVKYDLNPDEASFDSTDAGGFKLTLAGEVALDLTGALEGKLTFEGLEVTSDNRVKNFTESLTGGSVSYQDVFTASIDEFKLITKDTTIAILDPAGGTIDTGAHKGEPKMMDQRTCFYLKLGGSFNVKEMISGGVKSLLVYRKLNDNGEKGDINFVIDELAFKRGDNFEFTMMLTAQSGKPGEYLLSAAGMVRINDEYEFVASGKFGKWNNKVSVGLFLAATAGLNIQVGPVKVTGLGGGFFWNPVEKDIETIRTLCGFTDDYTKSIREKVKSAPVTSAATFSLFLYGAAALGSKELMEGRLLITVSDKKLIIDGKVTLLEREEEMYGLINAEVGFEKLYAEGTISVTVLVAEGLLFKANAQLQFFFYGPKNWGVLGSAEMALLGSLMKGTGELYAGSKGFFVSVSYTQGFDVWIVSIRGGFALKMWYKPAISWGAYFALTLDASVLGGVARAHGDIKGVLFGAPEFALAGGASLRVSLLFISWRGNIWMRLKKSGISAGFGKDSEVDKLIAQAENMSNDMLDAVNEAKDSMAAKPVPDLNFSEETIAAASSELAQRMIKARSLSEAKKLAQAERDSLKQWKKTEMTGVEAGKVTINSYLTTLEATMLDSVRDNVRRDLTTQLNVMNSAIAEYKTAIKQVSRELSKFDMKIVVPSTDEAESAEDPVSAASISKANNWPRSISAEPGTDGPQFDLSMDKVNSNIAKVNNYMNNAQNYHDILKGNVEKIEAAISNFDAVFANKENSFVSVGNKYVALENKVAEYHKMLSNYYFNDLRDILNNRSTLNNSAESFLSSIRIEFLKDRKKGQFNTYRRWARVRELAQTFSTPWDTAAFNTSWRGWDTTRQAQEAKDKANELYKNVPMKAFDALISSRREALAKVAAEYRNNIEEINTLASAYNDMLNELFAKRRKMAANLLEVTERFIYWKDRPKTIDQDQTIAIKNLAPTLTVLKAKQAALIISNTAPRVTVNQPVYQNKNAFTEYSFSWASPDANRIVDYILEGRSEGKKSTMVFPARSIGNTTQWNSAEFHDTQGVSTRNLSFILKARTISGYTSYNQILIPGVQVGFQDANMNTIQPAVNTGSFVDNTSPQLDSICPVGLSNVVGRSSEGKLGYYRQPTYITAKTSEFRMKLYARDAESGINSYEYKIEKRDNTKLLDTVRNWTSIGAIDDILVQGLQLKHCEQYISSNLWYNKVTSSNLTRYMVSVRAINGVGLKSNEVQFFLTVDTIRPKPPTFYTPTFNTKMLTKAMSYANAAFEKVAVPLPAPEMSEAGKTILFPMNQAQSGAIKEYIYRVYVMPEEISITDDYIQDNMVLSCPRYPEFKYGNIWVSGKKVNIPREYVDRKSFKMLIAAVNIAGGVSDMTETTISIAPYAVTTDDKAPVSTAAFTEDPTSPAVMWFDGVPPGYSGNMPSGNLNLYFQKPATHSTGILKYQYKISGPYPKQTEWRDLPEIPQDRILRLRSNFFDGTEGWFNPGTVFNMAVRAVSNNLIASRMTNINQVVFPTPFLAKPNVVIEEKSYSTNSSSVVYGITVRFQPETASTNKTYRIKTEKFNNGNWEKASLPLNGLQSPYFVNAKTSSPGKTFDISEIPGSNELNLKMMPYRNSQTIRGVTTRVNLNEKWRITITAEDANGNISDEFVKEITW